MTYPEGEARRITNDLNYYSGASITGRWHHARDR